MTDTTARTDVLVQMVLDASGSMITSAAATIEGVNGLIEAQRAEEGTCLLSLAQFSSYISVIRVAEDVREVPLLDRSSYRPGGGTALFDAVGAMILGTDEWLANHPDFTGKVLIVIFTDGEENSSYDFSGAPGLQRINDMIADRTEKGWDFQFMGAGDGWRSAEYFTSIPTTNRLGYGNNAGETAGAYKGLTHSLSSLRSVGSYAGVQ